MSINFTKQGNGARSIILLHGWGGSHVSMEKLQKDLVMIGSGIKGFAVYNIDLPGFGHSPLTKLEMTLADYVEVIKDFITENNIIDPILIGHSFGGKIIAKLACENAVQISGIVLISASVIKPLNEGKKSLMGKISGIGKKIFTLPLLNVLYNPLRKFFYYYIVRERDFYNAGEKLRKTFINVNSKYLDDELSKIKTPTLIVWGELDKVTPLWMGEKASQLIPNARLEVVSGAKHNLVIQTSEIISKIIYNYFSA